MSLFQIQFRKCLGTVGIALSPFVCLLPLAQPMRGAVQLASPFTDHMVLQREMPVPVWGMADPGRVLTVEFAGQSKTATVGTDGTWQVMLDPLAASERAQELTVRGDQEVAVRDVLVGEVWLCSGQSNMEVSLDRIFTTKFVSDTQKAEVTARIQRELQSTTPGLRLLRLGTNKDDQLKNIWTKCEPGALKKQPAGTQGFSAVGYFFGKKLHAELGVPVGLVEAAVGGTVIETWTPPDGRNYRQLVAGLAQFAIRGVIWYQGESNVIAGDGAAIYRDKMQALIQSWRKQWARPDLPFFYVQLPPMPYSQRRGKILLTPEALPILRDGQTMALTLPHTGMVVTTDLADAPDLHPTNKWDVGERLARLALQQTYGRNGSDATSPIFKEMREERGTLVLSFAHASAGLVSGDGAPLTGWVIAGADRHFVPGEAVIRGAALVVSSPQVPQPVAVRFGWHEESRPNLRSRSGLPVTPFRTDDWPVPAVRPESGPVAAEIRGNHDQP